MNSSNETYIVIARLTAGALVRVAGTMTGDWLKAQERWRFLDDARLKGRLYRQDRKHINTNRLYIEPVSVEWLAVRSMSDPEVAKATQTTAMFVTPGTGARDDRSLGPRWGKDHGYHGHAGGWIYSGPCKGGPGKCSRTSHQGWASIMGKHLAAVLQTGNVRFHLVKDMP